MKKIALITIWVISSLPSMASAHGIGEVYALPVPLKYYLLGAGLAVAFSFFILAIFLNKTSQDSGHEKSITILRLPRIIYFFRAVALALLILTIVSGIFGVQTPSLNFAPVFFWIYFLIGMGVLSLFIGNIWYKINPWISITKWLGVKSRENSLSGFVGVALLLGLFWLELVSGQSFVPRVMSFILLCYTLVNILMNLFFSNWYKNGEVFDVLFGFIGRLAHFRISDDNRSIVVLNESKKLSGTIAPWWILGFATALLAGASFDSLKETVMWYRWLDALGFSSLSTVAPTLGIILAPLPFLATYLIAVWLMKQLVGKEYNTITLAQQFVWSLIPIAFGYTLAHNFSLVVVAAPQMLAIISDPFGFGWNLFGTAGFQQTNLILGAKIIWFVEIGFIILAHVGGVWYAHILALNIFKNPKHALRSQSPLVILMVGYTAMTLWLLSQPLVVNK